MGIGMHRLADPHIFQYNELADPHYDSHTCFIMTC